MKTVTYEQFLKFNPCWLTTEEGRKRLRKYKEWWGDGKTALDILSLEEISAEDRLWTVLRPEFIDELILHEFAYRCAERALSHVDNPDPRSIAAIEAKRAWLRGEISNDGLCVARNEAQFVAQDATQDIEWEVAHSVAWASTQPIAQFVAQDVAWAATRFMVQFVARGATWLATQSISWGTAKQEECQRQVDELVKMLQE